MEFIMIIFWVVVIICAIKNWIKNKELRKIDKAVEYSWKIIRDMQQELGAQTDQEKDNIAYIMWINMFKSCKSVGQQNFSLAVYSRSRFIKDWDLGNALLIEMINIKNETQFDPNVPKLVIRKTHE